MLYRWNPSYLDSNGIEESVHISKVRACKNCLWEEKIERYPHFRCVFREGFVYQWEVKVKMLCRLLTRRE
jgi:hypothetical protein